MRTVVASKHAKMCHEGTSWSEENVLYLARSIVTKVDAVVKMYRTIHSTYVHWTGCSSCLNLIYLLSERSQTWKAIIVRLHRMTFSKRRNCREGKQIGGFQGQGVRGGDYKGATERNLRVMELFSRGCVDGYTALCTHNSVHWPKPIELCSIKSEYSCRLKK